MLTKLINLIPTRRDFIAFFLSFTIAGSISWVAGADSVSLTAGDSIRFAQGQIYAPTVRNPALSHLDRMARGLTRIVDPFISEHSATDNGDQSFIRFKSKIAAQEFYGSTLDSPTSSTKATRVTGGSSGLAWAIATLVLVQPNLVEGRVIAASAVLDENGWTSDVGGLEFKTRTDEISSTDILFVNSNQANEARALLSGSKVPVVIGVDSLAQAVGFLCASGPKGKVCDRYRYLANLSIDNSIFAHL